MKYEVKFPARSIGNKFYKTLSDIPQKSVQDKIMKAVEDLENNPYPYGKKGKDFFKKIKPPIPFYQLTAQYRLKIGNYRVLYDVDDDKRIVWILALRKRGEKTYK